MDLSMLLLSDGYFLAIKIVLILGIILQVVPLMVWIERRGSALMQNRLGPNRLGPLGIIQSLADVVKFIFKEDSIPGHVNRFYYLAAPMVAVIPAFMTFAVVPFAGPIVFDGKELVFQIADLDVGILYILAIASLGVYGIILAGWASNSKYALFGSLRSTAQMISYELALASSVAGILLVYSTVNLGEIADLSGYTFNLFGLEIPRWGIFLQPLGFLIFLTSVFAETNRLPFDLPEGESEIVAGYHLEYGSMKFALFFMAEYFNMTTASALLATLYFGGWQLLPGMNLIIENIGMSGSAQEWLRVGFQFASFWIKVAGFMWLFVWVRWTLPRFRYDQLMDVGWKVMLPLALFNFVATAAVIAIWR